MNSTVESLERRAFLSAAASPVTYQYELGAEFYAHDCFISMVATETAVSAFIMGGDNPEVNYSAAEYLELAAFEVAPNVKSAHLEATMIVRESAFGTDAFLLVVDVDFTAFEPADRYRQPLLDGRSLLISQGAEVSGSVTIEPLPDGPPLPSGMPTVLLAPEDGKVGAGSSAIIQYRLIQPPHLPDSFFAATRSTVAKDLFSQAPVLN